MKMRSIILAAAFALATAIQPASSQMLLLGVGVKPVSGGGGGGSSIAFDNSYGVLGNNGGSGNYSGSYTGATLTNGLLFLCVWGDFVDNISAATYGGNALTLAAKTSAPLDRYLYVFYLLNPPAGSNTLAVTSSGGLVVPSVAEYSGVKQTGQPDATFQGKSLSPNLSFAITIANANSWAIACARPSATSGTNSTFRVQNSTNGGEILDSNAPLSAGVFNMNIGSPAGIDIVIASFQPA